LPKRTELNTSSSRQTALELFYYFCVFFLKSSVRFGSIETNFKINWIWCIQVSKILNYVDLIDSVRSNRTELYTKKHKNNQKIRKSSGTVRSDKIELVRLSSVRFGAKIDEYLLGYIDYDKCFKVIFLKYIKNILLFSLLILEYIEFIFRRYY